MRYQFPYKTIFHDMDGSMLGKTAGSWAFSDLWTHNLWDGQCELDEDFGIVCDHRVTVRSFYIYGYSPSSLQQKDICVLQYDADSTLLGMSREEIEQYESAGMPDGTSDATCTSIPWRFIEVWPSNHWTAPFVTGHTYYMRFEYGLDFD